METFEQTRPNQRQAVLATTSFISGLFSLLFPVTAVIFLFTKNGGPGYLQSLICGFPFALTSLITGTVSLVQKNKNDQPGSWMAISGIVSGFLFFISALILVIILLFPFLSGTSS
ncbi:MAG: hypothetical protein CL609_25080 [Anaerolineaceae bacterium]|nr:hypothetical protein [Anaerolineaceae bacterium]